MVGGIQAVDSGSTPDTSAAKPPSDATGTSVAWAYWRGWRGPPELVAQIARRALWAVGDDDAERAEAACHITLAVGDDCERFTNPKEFTDLATADGLRHFARLEIHVCGPHGRAVTVEFVRDKASKADRPKAGVWLTAVGDGSRAAEPRNAVASSVRRRVARRQTQTGSCVTRTRSLPR